MGAGTDPPACQQDSSLALCLLWLPWGPADVHLCGPTCSLSLHISAGRTLPWPGHFSVATCPGSNSIILEEEQNGYLGTVSAASLEFTVECLFPNFIHMGLNAGVRACTLRSHYPSLNPELATCKLCDCGRVTRAPWASVSSF